MTNTTRIYQLIHPEGFIVREVPPQYSLDSLHALSAEYACGTPIPTAYAQQAVFEKMQKEGYRVQSHEISELTRLQ
ncbi:hypothetical protein RYA05_03460 [Pseudomonas syringae pv. actinidiae]|nr:hypothetical protein [Pseudomonas syringae pv. actinidiae]